MHIWVKYYLKEKNIILRNIKECITQVAVCLKRNDPDLHTISLLKHRGIGIYMDAGLLHLSLLMWSSDVTPAAGSRISSDAYKSIRSKKICSNATHVTKEMIAWLGHIRRFIKS